ncbi:hypothetical protein KP78_18490 [Jeotgalibacillus soli]|uniref:Arsenical pump membrane protein n=1 Tax=Jeotgalibacillus soli TaxID=889306 RepID=A0A0C2VQL2_9BACL|nr:hypothetical protein KP78_18490 [Jeotgalibacillus soli]
MLFRKDLPQKILSFKDHSIELLNSRPPQGPKEHPLSMESSFNRHIDWTLFKICIFIVILIRGSYFILSPLGVNIEWIAIAGAVILITIRWFKMGIGVIDILKKAPWHILVFAFGMYVTVYALNNTGITAVIIQWLEDPMKDNLMHASFIAGLLISFLSNIMNNLPAVMLGTIMITDMGLDLQTLQVSYISIIIGSDIGSLLSPMGTLATLLWMFVIKKNGIQISWSQYFKVALLVIPITLLITLISLNLWVSLILY